MVLVEWGSIGSWRTTDLVTTRDVWPVARRYMGVCGVSVLGDCGRLPVLGHTTATWDI